MRLMLPEDCSSRAEGEANLAMIDQFLWHTEYELAFDAIVYIADTTKHSTMPREFWLAGERVAEFITTRNLDTVYADIVNDCRRIIKTRLT